MKMTSNAFLITGLFFYATNAFSIEKHMFLADAGQLPNLKPARELTLPPGQNLLLSLHLKKGWHINDKAPNWGALFMESAPGKFERIGWAQPAQITSGTVQLPSLESKHSYRLQGTFYYCETKSSTACKLQSIDRKINVAETAGQPAQLGVELD